MKLWTIQPPEVYDIVEKDGVFICNPSKSDFISDFEGFKMAYDWLLTHMEKAAGEAPSGVKYPIWAWHTRNWEQKKPDLRESGYAKRGTELLCIQLEVPDNEVLLSDFNSWHFVLNNWYLSFPDSEEEYNAAEKRLNKLSPTAKQKEIEKSWERIFDISRYESDWSVRGRYIQANFWVLKREYIKSVKFFIAK